MATLLNKRWLPPYRDAKRIPGSQPGAPLLLESLVVPWRLVQLPKRLCVPKLPGATAAHGSCSGFRQGPDSCRNVRGGWGEPRTALNTVRAGFCERCCFRVGSPGIVEDGSFGSTKPAGKIATPAVGSWRHLLLGFLHMKSGPGMRRAVLTPLSLALPGWMLRSRRGAMSDSEALRSVRRPGAAYRTSTSLRVPV